MWQSSPWFDGLLGHSFHALVKLERFYGQIAEEDPFLIVTGDITACGSKDEYSSANSFLSSELRLPNGNDVGLGRPDWNKLGVSGNHDNWPGTPTIFGGPTIYKSKTYRSMPDYQRAVLLLSHGYMISFLMIDTDADVRSRGPSRFLARGAFRSELAKLGPKISVPEKKEIRVLLLHHSSQFTSGNPALQITNDSKRALYDFAAKHNVRIFLCGHTHLVRLKEFDVDFLNAKYRVFEACCGATTRRTDLPPDAANLWGAYPHRNFWRPNSLLVHRLLDDGTRLIWQTKVYFEKPTGFTEDAQLGHEIVWLA
jgi:3',5'-cyclic AMP phosphodiesterase CpdA